MRTTTRGSAKMLLGPTTKLRILHILTVLLASSQSLTSMVMELLTVQILASWLTSGGQMSHCMILARHLSETAS
jgi:hypothetical protein